MKKRWNALLFCLVVLGVVACVDPFEPAIVTQASNYLVVEGSLNSGSVTRIRLRRAVGLKDESQQAVVSDATVSIESEAGHQLYLSEGSVAGEYVSIPLELNQQDRYRLRIRTSDSKEYLSDFVTVKATPPIDSLSWTLREEGVQLFVSTHDPQDNTRYYRWEYEETWESKAAFRAEIKYENGEIVPRMPQPPIHCWKEEKSSDIIIGSSAKLNRDIIHLQPMVFIPRGSWKLSSRYSILVKQYGISRQAFEYYNQMKKNTEQNGSFFDPLPVELKGNIYSVSNPDEPVIGYFDGGSVQEKRIYINAGEVFPWGYRMLCNVVKVTPDSLDYYFGSGALQALYVDDSPAYYGTTDVECFDCSVKASPVKPSFWE